MRVGIVGAGSMGNAHAPGWQATDADIVGIVSTDNDRAEKLAEQLGAKVYDSYDKLIHDVDVIDLCTPTHTHHDMVLTALKAKKHVMCEKPIALTVEHGVEMIRAARDADVRLFIGMVLHFFPEYARMKASIEAGAIGKPQVVRMTRASYRPMWTQDSWFTDESKSGGMMLDLMIHDFEMSRWLTQGEAVRVYAKSVRGQNPDVLEDHALAIIRYDNGSMAHIEGSWAYPLPMFSVRAEVAGDGGLIEWDSDKTSPIEAHLYQTETNASDVALPGSPLAEDPWVSEVKHFYAALQAGEPFRVGAVDALRGLQIGLAAKESVKTGKPVNIQPVEV